MIIAGADIGKTGAIAILDGSDLVDILDMPYVTSSIAEPLLRANLEALREDFHIDRIDVAGVEVQQAFPKQGLTSALNLGRSWGTILGVLGGYADLVVEVRPQVWKPHFHLKGKDKEASRRLAIDLYPEAAARFARKKDEGRAEAVLIARYTFTTQKADQ